MLTNNPRHSITIQNSTQKAHMVFLVKYVEANLALEKLIKKLQVFRLFVLRYVTASGMQHTQK